MMKIVVAIDSLKGSLTSIQAGEAIEKGIKKVDLEAEVVIKPLADGGEGTVDALVDGMGGNMEFIKDTGQALLFVFVFLKLRVRQGSPC